jgi:sugar phosphate isomerase/epimerase
MKSQLCNAMDRRRFLQVSAGLAAASTLPVHTLFSLGTEKLIPVALQLYSVREDCATDFPGTIAAVAKIGYQGVEFAGYYNYSAQEVRKMLDDNGLKCAGTHTGLDTVTGDALEKTIEYNRILGNSYLIIPWLTEEYRNSKETWLKTCALFNELAEKVKPHGMRIGYHNHTFEFEPVNGEMPWDIFAQNTTEEVILQFDTSNAATAGADTLPYLKKYPGRSVTIHLKEYSATKPDALIGNGDIPFKEIIEVCRSTGGTKWFIVEEEKDTMPPLAAARISYDNLMKLL